MNKLRPYLVPLVVTMVAIAVWCSAGVYAFLTAHQNKVNALEVGDNNISIVEDFPVDEIAPDKTIVKQVAVRNDGSMDCYVRVAVEFSTSFASDSIVLDIDTVNWEHDEADGYYYYLYPIAEGETTAPLFTELEADNALDTNIGNFDIIVYAESVQANGHTSYSSAWDAFS